MWTKASDVATLQREFDLKASRDAAAAKAGQFQGIWISKKVLILGAVVLLPLAFYGAVRMGLVAPAKRVAADKAGKEVTAAEKKESDLALDRGRAWLAKNNVDNAITDLDEAIRLNPNNSAAFSSRGFAWLEKKDFDKALNDFDEAIRLDPTNELAFLHRGRRWLILNNYDNAIRDFTEAIRLNPEKSKAYNHRGRAWAALGDFDRAIKDFEAALRLDPSDRWARNNLSLAMTDRENIEFLVARHTQAGVEVKLARRVTSSGYLHGIVHNENGGVMQRLDLHVRTRAWERTFEVKTRVENKTTKTFSIFVGDNSADVSGLKIGWAGFTAR